MAKVMKAGNKLAKPQELEPVDDETVSKIAAKKGGNDGGSIVLAPDVSSHLFKNRDEATGKPLDISSVDWALEHGSFATPWKPKKMGETRVGIFRGFKVVTWDGGKPFETAAFDAVKGSPDEHLGPFNVGGHQLFDKLQAYDDGDVVAIQYSEKIQQANGKPLKIFKVARALDKAGKPIKINPSGIPVVRKLAAETASKE